MFGGEKQRIALARAVVNNPSIAIADEPTGSLDGKMADDIMSQFKAVNKSGTAFLIVTHDKIIANKSTHFDMYIFSINSNHNNG